MYHYTFKDCYCFTVSAGLFLPDLLRQKNDFTKLISVYA
jgi:hypothetical protein